MADRLDDVLVKDALEGLPAWDGDSNGITRTVPVAGPMADDLVARVSETAESMDHHPEIDREGETLTFRLVTHSAGGVTVTDIALASVIEDLVADVTGQPAQHGHHEVLTEAVEGSPETTDTDTDEDTLEPMIGQRSAGAGGPAVLLPSDEPDQPEPGVAAEQAPRHIDLEPGTRVERDTSV